MERSGYHHLNPLNNLSQHKATFSRYSANKNGPKSIKSSPIKQNSDDEKVL